MAAQLAAPWPKGTQRSALLLLLLWPLWPSDAAAAVAAEDDTVLLQLDLPPDVQRMFEEMCEMEGISQSEMLTRWIDARWEAMGYNDSDLEAFEAAERERLVAEGGDGSSGVDAVETC